MFENVPSIPGTQLADTAYAHAGVSVPVDGSDARAGDALRAIGWSELAARINAARDLRAVMRRDKTAHGSVSVASFGDAAASYFAAINEGERPVNPIALEGRKASVVIGSQPHDDAARGDRETVND